jgi:hypothetical protein
MRLAGSCLLLLLLFGVAAAQDTSFAAGPQYLSTTNSPLLLHSIATPSLSLGATPASAASETQVEAAPVETTSGAAPSDTFLADIYWGEHKTSEIVGRRLETPSMTPSETAWHMNAVANAVATPPTPISVPAAEAPPSGVIEISSAQLPASLPSILFDAGVTGTADSQSLGNLGYGLPLGEAAAFWKAHKGRAPHTYTNADIARFREQPRLSSAVAW